MTMILFLFKFEIGEPVDCKITFFRNEFLIKCELLSLDIFNAKPGPVESIPRPQGVLFSNFIVYLITIL